MYPILSTCASPTHSTLNPTNTDATKQLVHVPANNSGRTDTIRGCLHEYNQCSQDSNLKMSHRLIGVYSKVILCLKNYCLVKRLVSVK